MRIATASVRTGFAMTPFEEVRYKPGRAGKSAKRRQWRMQRGDFEEVPAWNPPVTASPCQPPLGKGAEGTGDADCHSQCAHWLRNDTF